ncbi:PEGA domain-containing protein [Patescibacteria group bacterium]|nr:PEGA domain-containing protein [Candidatus Falkowbacteria bacterium]MBU4015569.1 PEGA domain-containing protein [Patescibacteria group bacterium]MBU4026210.1 PEGA domain-containing protein [Patescibacteria group bacterium]MBU4072789.1 PEGA domain-containing protein [Patescibacteria group bacterium]MBU4103405.1 PEGA domain-containing protein [Patescibacteria group bacterium]
MSLKIRRFLYILFITAFFIITPMVIFYAAGYKFDSGGISFQKTGSFILDSEPQGANIFINGKPQQNFFKKIFANEESYTKTPAKIKGLLPEEYDLRIELEGYWPWQKKLSIRPGTSTYAEDVYLFRNNLPVSILSGEIKNLKLSPDKNKIAALLEGRLVIISVDDEEQIIFPIAEIGGDAENFSWAPSGKKIIIGKSVFKIDNLISGQEKIYEFENLNENMRWDAESDDKIYYSDKNSINMLALSTKSSKKIIENQNFIDYLIKGDYIYLVAGNKDLINLNIFKIDSGQMARSISMPGSPDYSFINPQNDLLNIYDKNHQILYFIDPLSYLQSPLVETISNVKYALWVDKNKLLYANDFEIWLFDMASGKKTLLTRISKAITSVIWHPSNNYVIYSTDESINIIELDERGKYNITEILKLNKISYPHLNQKGSALYFYAVIGNQAGLYKLVIQ